MIKSQEAADRVHQFLIERYGLRTLISSRMSKDNPITNTDN